AALREVGGVQVGSVTEDLDTTIELHKHGWKSAFHNAVVAVGLAAPDLETYLTQRNRWATGAMQIWRRRGPFLGPGLTWAQRWSYLATLTAWFDGWRTLVLTLLPLAVLVVGASPIVAEAWLFAALFGASFVAQQAALWMLSGGSATPLRSIEFDLLRLPATMSATLALVSPDPDRPFEVTRKGGVEDELRPPGLLVGLLVLHVAVLGWVGAAAVGVVGLTYTSLAVVVVSAFWAIFNLTLVIRALRRATDPRHRPDRRSAVRFATPWTAHVDGRRAQLHDLSLAGARVELFDAGPAADVVCLEVGEGPDRARLRTRVLRQRVSSGRRTLHIAFGSDHQETVSSLLFQPREASHGTTSGPGAALGVADPADPAIAGVA
ncbi:MAG: glycosyltransferase family 2 protein, partial [Nitriliruptorales bacterium]|nr:glycosyltransferase family 2 protein [Nitriliruptorales bacterium]